MHVLLNMVEIAWTVVLPVMLLLGLGFLIQKKLGLDMPTMIRLNFYVVAPGIVFFAVVNSQLSGADVGKVVGFTLGAMVIWSVLTYTVAKLRGVPSDQTRAMLMTSLFYNSGNYGLPVQELAFRSTPFGAAGATGLQVFVLIIQNVTTFSLGVLLATGRPADGQWRKTLLTILRFPPIYALSSGLLVVGCRELLGENAPNAARLLQPFWDTAVIVKNGFIVVALVTLGAQLALVERGHGRAHVSTTVALRLIAGPVVGFVLLKTLGWTGPVAQVLLISTAMPTAVNCMLICMEFDNHPAFVARSVFYSTILSPITVTLTIMLAHGGAFGPAGG